MRIRNISRNPFQKPFDLTIGLLNSSSLYRTQHLGPASLTVICEVCTKMLKNREQLRQHLKTHSEEKKFECNVCLKRFKWDTSLNTHVQAAHNPTGPAFKCDHCGRMFKDKNNLKKHLFTHTNEKPYRLTDAAFRLFFI